MREELVRGLAGTRVLRAQLREGDKRREQELLAAAADCVSTAKLSPSSGASGPSVTSVASLEAEEQVCGTSSDWLLAALPCLLKRTRAETVDAPRGRG